MYIVTFEEFSKAMDEWYNGAGTFHSLEGAKDFMAFVLKMGGKSYRDVKLWTAEEVEYRVNIIVEN